MHRQHSDGHRGEHPLAPLVALLDSLAARANEAFASARPTLNRWHAQVRTAAEALTPARDWLATNGPAVLAGLVAIRKYAAEAHVENWADLEEDEWLAALSLMQADDGVPLAWLPPGNVVQALVTASSHAERDAILLDHADEIADQAADLIAAVTHERLNDLQTAVTASWATWRDGHHMAAQALAAACVTAAMEDHRGYTSFGSFRQQVSPFRSRPFEDWSVAVSLRRTALDCAWVTAIERTDEGLPGFNRHATAHHVSPEQYTGANSLRSLMLATALVRELQFDYANEWLAAEARAGIRPAAASTARAAAAGPHEPA